MYGKNCNSGKEVCGVEEDSPGDSMDDDELFLNKLARENEKVGMKKRQQEDYYVPINNWLVPYLGLEKHHEATSGGVIDNIIVLPAFTPSMSPPGQSHLPNLVESTDVSANSSSLMMKSHGYIVHSLVSSHVGEADETQRDIGLGCHLNARI
jgi:hypothetical protein